MIHIQSNNERTLPSIFDSSCAMYGAMERGLRFRLTSFEEVASGKYDLIIKSNLFVGSVEFMREVFSRVTTVDIRLPKNSNRTHELITLGEIFERTSKGEKLFIKPIKIKHFTGFVHEGMQYSCLNDIPLDTVMMVYEPFKSEIISEWRCYIHDNKIVDSRNYSGDMFVVPDVKYINNIINENKTTFPCAYTIDVGVLANDENVVVEYNDMWAIGNYGIENHRYLRMLTDRYFEIMRSI
jgi:hypothetical protein